MKKAKCFRCKVVILDIFVQLIYIVIFLLIALKLHNTVDFTVFTASIVTAEKKANNTKALTIIRNRKWSCEISQNQALSTNSIEQQLKVQTRDSNNKCHAN